MSKQRFLGGLLGANPLRDGSFTDQSTLDTYDFSNATVQLGSNGGASAYVGYDSVSISKDGNTAVASSQFADSSAGQVLVFEKSGGTWSEVADFDCPESASEVSFGHDTDISDDGTVIIVSDNTNKKNSTTSTGIQQGNVYVYEKGAGWANGVASHTKTFLVTDNNHNGVNYLGDAITISGDGNTIAAGNRLGTSNRAYASSKLGSVYLWEKNGTWAATSSTPTILISNSQATNGKFGCDEKHAISLSEDGQTLAIRHEARTTEGRLEIHEAGGGGWTAPSNSSATSAHHVSILDGTGSGNGHGNRVAISNDGLTIASEVTNTSTIIIHEKGAGWPSVGMTSQVATLSNSAATTIQFNGMSKDGKYVTAYDTSSYELLIWVKPATGWVDATETYRIAADATSTSTFAFGQWAAISDAGDLIISDNRHASNAGRVEFHSGTNSVDTARTTSNVGILSLDEAGPEDVFASIPDQLDSLDGFTVEGDATASGKLLTMNSTGNAGADIDITNYLPSSGYVYWEARITGDTNPNIFHIMGLWDGSTDLGASQAGVSNCRAINASGQQTKRYGVGGALSYGSTDTNLNRVQCVLVDVDSGDMWVGQSTSTTGAVRWASGTDGAENTSFTVGDPSFSAVDLTTYKYLLTQMYRDNGTTHFNFGGNPLFNGEETSGNDSATWYNDPPVTVSSLSIASSETRELTQLNWGGIRGRDPISALPSTPSLDLNFDGQSSSYTRATTAEDAAKANGDQLATSIVTQNKSGTVQSMYMGPNGKLIKGYVTNIRPYSTATSLAFPNASWTSSGGEWAAFNSNDTLSFSTAPDGTNTAVRMQLPVNSVQIVRLFAGSNYTIAAGETQTVSFWIKDRLATSGYVLVEPYVDTVVGRKFTYQADRPQNQWVRITHTFTNNTGSDIIKNAIDIEGDNSTAYDFDLWGFQIEEGAAASEYVATSGASASDQVARIEYDASGNPLGLLVEEQRENLWPSGQSNFGTATAGGGSTASTTAVTAPDGTTNNIWAITESGTAGSHHVYTGISGISASTAYTASYYLKKGSEDYGFVYLEGAAFSSSERVWFDLVNGTVGTETGSSVGHISDAGNGWYRCSVTTTSGTTLTTAYASVGFSSTDGNFNSSGASATTGYYWGMQVEAGEGPTSLIYDDTASSVTRAADDITLATSNFGVDPADATLVVQTKLAQASTNTSVPRLYELHAGSNNDRNLMAYSDQGASAIKAQFWEGGAATTLLSASSVTYPFDMVHAQRREGTSGTVAVDGTLGSSATITQGSTTPTELVIGQNLAHGSQIIGHIRRFTYWPRAISDDQLAEYSYDLNFGGRMEYRGILSLNEVTQSRR